MFFAYHMYTEISMHLPVVYRVRACGCIQPAWGGWLDTKTTLSCVWTSLLVAITCHMGRRRRLSAIVAVHSNFIKKPTPNQSRQIARMYMDDVEINKGTSTKVGDQCEGNIMTSLFNS